MIEGNLEHFDADKIRGWARSSSEAGSVVIEVWINNRCYKVPANRFREDLERAFGGQANYGFEFDLGSNLHEGENKVRIKVESFDFEFPNSSRSFVKGDETSTFFTRYRVDRGIFRFRSALEERVSKEVPSTSSEGRLLLSAILEETKVIFVLFSIAPAQI